MCVRALNLYMFVLLSDRVLRFLWRVWSGLLRCGKSCRLRWINYLRPDIKRGNFGEDEEDLIIKLHALLGNRCVVFHWLRPFSLFTLVLHLIIFRNNESSPFKKVKSRRRCSELLNKCLPFPFLFETVFPFSLVLFVFSWLLHLEKKALSFPIQKARSDF